MNFPSLMADPLCVCLKRAPIAARAVAASGTPALIGASVYPNFLTPAEAAGVEGDVLPLVKRRRYEGYHWDAVISGYRETSVPFTAFDPASPTRRVVDRVLAGFPADVDPMSSLHVLDLQEEGTIDNHIDNVGFSGRFIVGVCLLSDAVMELTHMAEDGVERGNGDVVSLLLPKNCLYVLTDEPRYRYGHAVLPGPQAFGDTITTKTRRVSLLFRDEPPPADPR